MNSTLRTYLEWRFRVNNHPKYQKYRDEWIQALTPMQLIYFEQERIRMIKMGLYK